MCNHKRKGVLTPFNNFFLIIIIWKIKLICLILLLIIKFNIITYKSRIIVDAQYIILSILEHNTA